MTSPLEKLVGELERDRSLDEPAKLRERDAALDRLDDWLQSGVLAGLPDGLFRQARTIYDKLEAINFKLYESIRAEIRRGAGGPVLLKWGTNAVGANGADAGEGYDYLDELVSGVLQFEQPCASAVEPTGEMVFYQPTPARHIFDMIGRAGLTKRDVLIDLGAGLGHVSMLASICTGASSVGIEREGAYVDCARQSALSLNLNLVSFVKQDARMADLTSGTVFYLYTPFTGTILDAVLSGLRRQAASRTIRVCTYGPCTATVAEERWLETTDEVRADRVAVFRSRR